MKKICDLIDVSKHQGVMPWPTVKSTGVSHAMLRAGFGRYSSQRDPQFDRNVEQCEANGIAWGAYWYSYATGVAEARQEARVFLAIIAEKVAQGYKPTLPLAYDIEYEPGILALSNATRTEMVKAFLSEVEAAGYYGILYASTDFIRNRLTWRDLAQYDVWCAQYGSRCTCPLPYGIWQYSSTNALGIPGFGKSLDCNHAYKDYPAIIAAMTGTAPEAPADDGGSDLSAKRQIVTVGPVSTGDAAAILSLCQQLQLTTMGLYKSAWADAAHATQIITIGPVSSGDAWRIMRECERLELTDMGLYRSEYAD